jgi:hypothetical protein
MEVIFEGKGASGGREGGMMNIQHYIHTVKR